MRLIDIEDPALFDKVYIPSDNAGIEEYPRMIEWVDLKAAPTVDAVVLPLKPGDIVYCMNRYRRKVWPMKIASVEINSQGISEYGCWCDVPDSYTPVCFRPIAIGKTVFFTQEEAEAALAEMKGGASNV